MHFGHFLLVLCLRLLPRRLYRTPLLFLVLHAHGCEGNLVLSRRRRVHLLRRQVGLLRLFYLHRCKLDFMSRRSFGVRTPHSRFHRLVPSLRVVCVRCRERCRERLRVRRCELRRCSVERLCHGAPRLLLRFPAQNFHRPLMRRRRRVVRPLHRLRHLQRVIPPEMSNGLLGRRSL